MVPPEYLHRHEFDGYVRRHESDVNAHGALRRLDTEENQRARERLGDRLSALELWQARIVGGLAMLTFLVATGVITAVVELLRR